MNCTGSGRSNPSWWRSAATCAGVAVSPATSATGSLGITRKMTNVTASSPRSVGTNHRSRWRSSASSLIAPSPYAAREPRLSLLLRVIHPAHLLAVADRAEADAVEVLRPRAEVLGVVDPHAGRLVHDDARRVLVGLLPNLPIGGFQRHVEQLVHLGVLVEARGLERAPLTGMEHLADPVVGIGVVRADPVDDEVGRRLRLLHALDHVRPQLAGELGVEAELAQAVRHDRRRLLGLAEPLEKAHRQRTIDLAPGLRELLLGLLDVVGIALHVARHAP